MEEKIGVITHFYSKIGVAIIKLVKPLTVGDKIHVLGATTDFKEEVKSIQEEHQSIPSAKKGQEVGIKVKEKVREGDEVYLVK